MTNREIYKAVRGFSKKVDQQAIPSLEKYLTALWSIVSQERQAALTPEKFVEWLERAFVTPAPELSSEWLQGRQSRSELAGFDEWEERIRSQIVDLRSMNEAGMLGDEFRYFGINAPTGSRWYNFDPLTYLECAVAGALGGYAGDEVKVFIPPPQAESTDSPIYEVTEFSWDTFIGILECGRCYE